ncbi:DUF1775 domain-containing protein [Bacillus sonorensis]|uniref:YncI copper-binding domain-containing protein n=2 Tax=Bacillus sonorensis TaxID=119858 RepID=M5P3K0_9BACI|nr:MULTISPECIES: DUF1775 domain-containing protein [Bacillus]TWK75321.1 hypothetical protein CHCC20335_1053 [Bacillus paralicheniformis]ASB91028.1 uncharacterized protein S101395_04540 [Bacillus sonorensis]EME74004.1 hypothetical protein BSONL12_13606 [Bacillus sonorensis L12]MBG9913460.1 hypothetical protein [Bacillus sonorensis]MCF7619829.1 DUF1775 domain-containing protein [Bacillus sonorensis]
MLKRNMFFLSAVFAALLLITVPVSAHVTVKPDESAAGSWETYTIKVPVEKNMATTKVVLSMPDGVEFQQYEPVPGWKTSTETAKNGNVTRVTWEAANGGIKPGEFQQFTFTAKNPDKEQKAAWDAYQYYKDGSIVEWTGDENADTPHSITNIVDASKLGSKTVDEHGATKKEAPAEAQGNSGIQTASLILSILAVLLGGAALLMAVRRKKS